MPTHAHTAGPGSGEARHRRHRAPAALAALLAAALVAAALLSLALPETGGERASDSRRAGERGAPWRAPASTLQAQTAPALAARATPKGTPFIGTNDATGWGRRATRTILRAHITWAREDLSSPYRTLASTLGAGFRVLAIVGNLPDREPLGAVDPAAWGKRVLAELRAHPRIAIAEAGNESDRKGPVAEPVQYGRMYLAAVEDLRAAGIRVPLLFNLTGDYALGSRADPTGWSQDANGGGWLHDAVAGVPGLAAAILANGVSVHPYGGVRENSRDAYGVGSVAALESVAQIVLGAVPPFYVTEIGYDLSRCGQSIGACSQSAQARKLRAAYDALLADPHVAGIWWYQSHDDHTGAFGFMNDNGTTRPAFSALASFAARAARR